MLTLPLLLIMAAFVCVVASAMGRAPLWMAVFRARGAPSAGDAASVE